MVDLCAFAISYWNSAFPCIPSGHTVSMLNFLLSCLELTQVLVFTSKVVAPNKSCVLHISDHTDRLIAIEEGYKHSCRHSGIAMLHLH